MVPSDINKQLYRCQLKYNDAAVVEYDVPGTGKKYIIVRQLTFKEYLSLNDHIVNLNPDPKGIPRYDINPDIADNLLSKILVYPEDLEVSRIPPGIIIKSCIKALQLSKLEDFDVVSGTYFKSIKNMSTILGQMKHLIIKYYGIEGYLALDKLSEIEIIELIVSGEFLNDEVGILGQILGIELPMKGMGKHRTVDVETIMGFEGNPNEAVSQQSSDYNKKAERYRTMGFDDKQIEELLHVRGYTNNKTHKDPSEMTREEYIENKREGKLPSYNESIEHSIEESKQLLSQTVGQQQGKMDINHEMEKMNRISSVLPKIMKQLRDGNVDFEDK